METTFEITRPTESKGYVKLIREQIINPISRQRDSVDSKGRVVKGELIKLEGNHGIYPLEKIATIRNQVSATLKYQFPEREYSVNKMSNHTLVYWERRDKDGTRTG